MSQNSTLLPEHVAIIMDGNGRWAKQRLLPRIMGHKAGVTVAKNIIQHALKSKIKVLSLFAFSSENWNRPQTEVSFLMDLFIKSLTEYIDELHQHGIRVRFIGDRTLLADKLQQLMHDAESLTLQNQAMQLVLAINYGGRWDLTHAVQQIATAVQAGNLAPQDINERTITEALSTALIPEPDLLIRTSGEMRISNYYLWQMTYTEFYFTQTYWPQFTIDEFDAALEAFAARERRYGFIESSNETVTA